MHEVADHSSRVERDFLGPLDIPENAYWGVHTQRAIQNFRISGVSIGQFPELIRSIACIKQAAAKANRRLGALDASKADAIEKACECIILDEKFCDHFPVDVIQGGAGTSTNMNLNEVIANMALECLGHSRGEYQLLHPNDDVNMSQSTNDVYPSSLRLAILFMMPRLIAALQDLADAFEMKADEFCDILKLGRTQLQDAVPMTLGQEFGAFAGTVRADISLLIAATNCLREVNLGATAIGTGINADPSYASFVVEALSEISGQSLRVSPNLIEATSDIGAFVSFSGAMKRVAIRLSKICNDLRLLSSGPCGGFGEIHLPPVQAGSSIMPGKINPVIPEMVNQVAFLIVGYDATVTMCSEGGQLQLNAFEPMIGYCILSAMRYLSEAVTTLTDRCVVGIEADHGNCRLKVEKSVSLATALVPTLGYDVSSQIAKRALAENRSIVDIVLEEGVLSKDRLETILSASATAKPSVDGN
jgi:aspartate ammonia-lyase